LVAALVEMRLTENYSQGKWVAFRREAWLPNQGNSGRPTNSGKIYRLRPNGTRNFVTETMLEALG
jgi:hypothetical protein